MKTLSIILLRAKLHFQSQWQTHTQNNHSTYYTCYGSKPSLHVGLLFAPPSSSIILNESTPHTHPIGYPEIPPEAHPRSPSGGTNILQGGSFFFLWREDMTGFPPEGLRGWGPLKGQARLEPDIFHLPVFFRNISKVERNSLDCFWNSVLESSRFARQLILRACLSTFFFDRKSAAENTNPDLI